MPGDVVTFNGDTVEKAARLVDLTPWLVDELVEGAIDGQQVKRQKSFGRVQLMMLIGCGLPDES